MVLIGLDAIIFNIWLLNCLYKQCATKGQNELAEIIRCTFYRTLYISYLPEHWKLTVYFYTQPTELSF